MPSTLVISDTHMGHPRGLGVRDAAMLRPLWQGIDQLIVNGDVAEVYDDQHYPEGAQQIDRLRDLTRRDGVELHLIAGNHDPQVGDVRHMELHDGEVFLTHGDALHPQLTPWNRDALEVEEYAHRLTRQLIDEIDCPLQRWLIATKRVSFERWQDHLSRGNKPDGPLQRILQPFSVLQIIAYWRTLPDLIGCFAQWHGLEARYFIFGHSHWHGIWRRHGLTIINTGSFDFPGKPRAVRIDHDPDRASEAGHLTIHAIGKRNGSYRLAERPLRNFTLNGQASQTDTSA